MLQFTGLQGVGHDLVTEQQQFISVSLGCQLQHAGFSLVEVLKLSRWGAQAY